MNTTATDRMAPLRAMRGTVVPKVSNLLSVEALESMAAWHLKRDPAAVLGASYNGSGIPTLCVPLGTKTAKRKVFAIRSAPRCWHIRFGSLTPRSKKEHSNGSYSTAGYVVQEFVTPDGKREDVFYVSGTYINNASTVSARALAHASPFVLHTKASVGEDSEGVYLAKMEATFSEVASTNPETYMKPMDVLNRRVHSGATWGTGGPFFHADRENNILWMAERLREFSLLMQSSPARDYAALGFVGSRAGWETGLRTHFAGDNDAVASASRLASILEMLKKDIAGLQIEYIYPGHVWTGSRWQRAMPDSKYEIAGYRQDSIPKATVPTCNWMTSLAFADDDGKTKLPPPCLLLTLPMYQTRHAVFESGLGFTSNQEPRDKPPKVKQILLYPCPSKTLGEINPDLHDNCEAGFARRCNFAGKNDWKHRGATYPLAYASGPGQVVAFCCNGPTDEYLSSYWCNSDSRLWSGGDEQETKMQYGLIGSVDEVVTRIGAIIAEQFFANAS